MKQIWPWLLLLLLLIIFCVWSKIDEIYASIHPVIQAQTNSQVTAPLKSIKEEKDVDFIITQQENGYSLKGTLKDLPQQTEIVNAFQVLDQKLDFKEVFTDTARTGEAAVALLKSIVPVFVEKYRNGTISYQDSTLVISGVADSEEAQLQMQRLLSASTVASQDNSTVADKPIHYKITKNGDQIEAEGIVGSQEAIAMIHAHLPKNASSTLTKKTHRIDAGSLPVVDRLLPYFIQHFTQGMIAYDGKSLTLSGYVSSEEELSHINTLLANTSVPTINHTKIDPEIVARKEAEAKQVAEQKAKEMEAHKKALAEATDKARIDAVKEASLKQASMQAEKERMRAEITNLLQLHLIEFHTNKSTLTQKGQATVDKLANILKKYGSIRIEIAGHTDPDGKSGYNLSLSQSRADTVKAELIKQDIEASRLVAKGYGESRPLVPNTSPENKAKNRRVEITIIGE